MKQRNESELLNQESIKTFEKENYKNLEIFKAAINKETEIKEKRKENSSSEKNNNQKASRNKGLTQKCYRSNKQLNWTVPLDHYLTEEGRIEGQRKFITIYKSENLRDDIDSCSILPLDLNKQRGTRIYENIILIFLSLRVFGLFSSSLLLQ